MNNTSHYAFEQSVPITAELYEKIRARIGPEPMDGLVVHLVVRAPDGAVRYIDVWTSKDACDRAMRERIHPAVQAVFAAESLRPNAEPRRTVIDVIDVMRGA